MSIAAYALAPSRADQELAWGASPAPLRLTMLRGETLRLPRGSGHLRVVRGRAWLSSGRAEEVLVGGACLDLPAEPRFPLLVTAIGEEELSIVVERDSGR